MSKRAKIEPIIPLTSRDEMEAALGEYRQTYIERERLALAAEKEKAAIDERVRGPLAKFDARLAELLLRLQDWAERNKADFLGKKSLETAHGIIGWRIGNPTLRRIGRATWAQILELLRKYAPHYIRTVEEIDKRQLIADRDQLGAQTLAQLGLTVEQDETFFVQPKVENLE